MNHYYEAPSDEAFEEMKRLSMELWQTYDNTYGYADGKIKRIKDLDNIQDNFMYMFVMFDHPNQCKIISKMSPTTREKVRSRMISGGNPESFITSLGL